VTISRCEGRPNAVLEAIAAGAPLVVSDIPAHRAVLGDDAASFVDGSDAQAVAAAVVAALRDRPAAERRAARARAALAGGSFDDVTGVYLRAYAEAVALGAGR